MFIIEIFFLIDYENVGPDGMEGCENLTKTDTIHLFFTQNASKIDLGIIANHGNAKLEVHEVPSGKQSADIHIASYLGFLSGIQKGKDCKIIIISKDTDFDNVIKFWKSEAGINGSRSPKISMAITKSANKKPSDPNTVKINGAQKTKLNQETMQTLRAAGYSANCGNTVAHIVTSHLGQPRFLNEVHNELRQTYNDYSDIYATLKPILNKYATNEETGISDKEQNNTSLNTEVRKILSNANLEQEIVDYVASLVVKNAHIKNRKQQIYRTIVSKYGQNRGLNIYNHIKKKI